jgi:hypothetical protein
VNDCLTLCDPAADAGPSVPELLAQGLDAVAAALDAHMVITDEDYMPARVAALKKLVRSQCRMAGSVSHICFSARDARCTRSTAACAHPSGTRRRPPACHRCRDTAT